MIYADDTEKAKRYLAKAGSSYPNLVDPGGKVAIDYGVAGVPETFFISREGQILQKTAMAVNVPLMREMLATLEAR